MTPLPKHLRVLRDELAQAHYDERAKLFNVHEFDRETIARDVEYNRGVIVGWNNGCTYQEQVDREVIEGLVKALELASNNVVWWAKANDGSDVLHTYGYHIQKCQEALAAYHKSTGQETERR